MIRRFGVVVALVLSGLGGLVAAPRQLTLDDAITIALRENKKVQIARLGVEKAKSQVREAFGNALPSLDLTAQFNRNTQVPIFFIPNFEDPSAGLTPIRVGLNNQYFVTAQARQILFNSAVFTGIGASKIYEDAAEKQLTAAIAEAVTETKKRFYGALLAKELGTIARATLANTEETLRTIEALFREGLVAEYDLIRVQVALDNVKPAVTDADALYQNAVGALTAHLGLPQSEELEPVGSFAEPAGDLPTEDAAIVDALKNNYEIIAVEEQVNVSREFVDVYRGDYFPTLALIGQWQNQGQSDTFSNWLQATTSFVGLNFSVNLFNGLKSQSKIEQASIDHQTASTQLQQLKDYVRLQVRMSMNTVKSARLRIDAQQSTVRQAERGLEIARIRYSEGTGSLLEISDAESALARARVNRIQALHDYAAAVADVEKVTGRVDPKYTTVRN